MNKELLQEVVRFCIVGGITFLVDYGLLFVFTEIFNFKYIYSSAIAFTLAVIMNYWLCVAFVFKNMAKQTIMRKITFIASSVIGLGLNQICMYLLVEFVVMHYMMAKIIATVVVMLWNYVTKRKAVQG